MGIDEETLKTLWPSEPEPQENKEALSKVLKKSSQTLATKDLASLFVGWIWVIFLGFGASIYSAKRRYELHKTPSNTVTELPLTETNKRNHTNRKSDEY